MVATLGSIEVIFSTNTDQFNAALRNASSAVDQHASRMNRAVQSTTRSMEGLNRSGGGLRVDAFRQFATNALHADSALSRVRNSLLSVVALAGGFAGAFAVKGLVETADAYTNIQNKIRVITTDSRERVHLENQLFAMSLRTRTSLEDTVKLYSRMDLAIGNKISQADKMAFLETVQKSFQVSGMSAAEQSSAALELSHGIDSGRIQARTLRPLLMEDVALGRQLAKIISGGDLSKLREMAQKGLLTPLLMLKAIAQAAPEIDAQFRQVIPTVASSIITLSNAFLHFVGTQNDSLGASHKVATGIIELADNFQTLGDEAMRVGIIMAGLFAGRFVGAKGDAAIKGIANYIGDSSHARMKALEDARAVVEPKRQASIMAGAAAQKAAADRQALEAKPLSEIASASAQAGVRRATVQVDSIKAAEQKANAEEAAALARKADIEARTAVASEAALRRQQAAKAAIIKQDERIAALRSRAAVAEQTVATAGGTVNRSHLAGYYNALGQQVGAQGAFNDLLGQQSAARSHGSALQESLGNAQAAGNTVAVASLQNLLAQNLAAQEKFTGQRIELGHQLLAADKALAAEEARIDLAQLTEKERAEAGQGKILSQLEAAEARKTALHARLAAADTAVDESRLADMERNAIAMRRIDEQAGAARGRGNEARAALGPAQAGLGQAIGNVRESSRSALIGATQEEADTAGTALRAELGYAQSLDVVAVAQREASTGAIALNVAMRGVAALGSSALAFLGGPFGAAIAAVGVGLALWTNHEHSAAEAATEHRQATEQLTLAIERYQKALNAGPGGSSRERNAAATGMNAAAAANQKSIDAARAQLQTQVLVAGMNARSAVEMGMAGAIGAPVYHMSSALDGLGQSVVDLTQKVTDGKAPAEELVNQLNQIGSQGPAMASLVQPLLAIAIALSNGEVAAKKFNAAIRAAAQPPSVAGFSKLDFVKTDPSQVGPMTKKHFDWQTKIQQQIDENRLATQGDSRGALFQRYKYQAQQSLGGADLTKDDLSWINKETDSEIAKTNALKARGAATHEAASAAKKAAAEAKKLSDNLKQLAQDARIAGLSELNQKIVGKAQSYGFSSKEVDSLIGGLKSGNTTGLSSDSQKLIAGETQLAMMKKARSLYDESKTAAQKYAEAVTALNYGLAHGAMTQEMFNQAMKHLNEGADFKWVDKMSSSVGSALKSMVEHTKSAKNAWLDFRKSMADLAWSTLVEGSIKQLFRSLLGPLTGAGGGATGTGGGGLIGTLLGSLLHVGGGGSAGASSGGLLGGFGGFLASLFGGGGAAASGASAVASSAAVGGMLYHMGGTVGPGIYSRAVPAGTFAGAPRYHGGLSPGEFPAILQHGEHVLTASGANRTAGTIAGLSAAAAAGPRTMSVHAGDVVIQGNVDSAMMPRIRAEMDARVASLQDTMQRHIGAMSSQWSKLYG